MTAVSILRVDFREIKEIRLTCGNCTSEITIPLERDLPKFLECPGCNKHLWGNGHQGKAYQLAQNIFVSVKNWQRADHSEFTLGFSLPQHKDT